MEEQVFDSILIKLTNEEYANALKSDLVDAGVGFDDVEITVGDDGIASLNILNVQQYMVKIINMFRNDEYNMTIEEISKLLNINID